jgi:hypothetical protein
MDTNFTDALVQIIYNPYFFGILIIVFFLIRFIILFHRKRKHKKELHHRIRRYLKRSSERPEKSIK